MPTAPRGRFPRRRRQAAAVLVAGTLVPAAAGEPPDLPTLSREHVPPSGAFRFRTPADWRTSFPSPGVVESWGGELGVRFVYRPGENGFDSLHVDCMMERLAGPMEQAAQVEYEYDFVGGIVADRRALDSAFRVRYDAPVRGHRDWRQRNVTVVGGGHSLCAIAYAPSRVWKGSREAQALLGAVLASLTFR